MVGAVGGEEEAGEEAPSLSREGEVGRGLEGEGQKAEWWRSESR